MASWGRVRVLCGEVSHEARLAILRHRRRDRGGIVDSIRFDGTAGGKPYTSYTSFLLKGQVSGTEFTGAWEPETGGSAQVKATRK